MFRQNKADDKLITLSPIFKSITLHSSSYSHAVWRKDDNYLIPQLTTHIDQSVNESIERVYIASYIASVIFNMA